MHGVNRNCKAYNELYEWWVNENDEKQRQIYFGWMQAHRHGCPTCRAETAELTRLASRAVMPEIDVREATR